MTAVVITVRGESEARVRAEEAAVRVSVTTDGPARGPVVERAQEHGVLMMIVQCSHNGHSIVARSSAGFTPRARANLTMMSNVGLRRPRSRPLM